MSLMKLATSYLDISAEESKMIAITQNLLHMINKYNMARRHWWGGGGSFSRSLDIPYLLGEP